jgi:hypothetical protein
MAKNEPVFMVEKADLKNYSLSEQRRFLDLGLVKGETPPAEVAEKAAAKK